MYVNGFFSIVEINQSLVDDGLVEKEKIGGSNYFWSFPAKKDRMMQLKYEQTLTNIEALKVKVSEAEAKLADARRGREEDEHGERAKKLAKLVELENEKKAREKELEALQENDPQVLADLEKELQLVKEAAYRWTDNIFNCKSYLVWCFLSTFLFFFELSFLNFLFSYLFLLFLLIFYFDYF
jgi:hypothetical protein